MLTVPTFIGESIDSGEGVPQAWTYASDNPLVLGDPNGLDVINNSQTLVAVKPGGSDQEYRIKRADGTYAEVMVTAQGEAGDSKPIELAPGETIEIDQDGVAISGSDGSVFKSIDGFDVTVSDTAKGIEVSARPGAKWEGAAVAADVGGAVFGRPGGGASVRGAGVVLQKARGGWKSTQWVSGRNNWRPLSAWAGGHW